MGEKKIWGILVLAAIVGALALGGTKGLSRLINPPGTTGPLFHQSNYAGYYYE